MSAPPEDFRAALIAFVRQAANPPDKFTHQARLHHLCRTLAEGTPADDDVLFAAAWLHDVGVFIGHRPADPAALAAWDNVAYACQHAPEWLRACGFSARKIAAVVEAISQHLPSGQPATLEARILRDADILEQLGAAGILRTVSKVGRDTRFVTFADALRALRRQVETLPGALLLPRARELAVPRVAALRAFLEQAGEEASDGQW